MWKLGDAVDAVITNAAIPIDREIPVINNGITSIVINDGWNRYRGAIPANRNAGQPLAGNSYLQGFVALHEI